MTRREFLERHPLAEQAIIISHSMGGLVTRSALRDGAEPLLAGVVHTVTPSEGAPVAYRRFQTGATNPFDGGFFNIPARVLNGIMGSTRIEYAVTQARLRGPLELLPGASYPEEFVRFVDNRTNLNVPDIFEIYLQRTAPGVVPTPGEQDPDTVVVAPSPFPTPFAATTIPGFRAERADADALSDNLRRARSFDSPSRRRCSETASPSSMRRASRSPTSGVRQRQQSGASWLAPACFHRSIGRRHRPRRICRTAASRPAASPERLRPAESSSARRRARRAVRRARPRRSR